MAAYIIYPSEEQERLLKAFLEGSGIPFVTDDDEELPQHVPDGIKRGQEDVAAGRTITLEQFKKRFSSSK